MTIVWPALPMLVVVTAGMFSAWWFARYEQRTGKALFFLIPYAPWSRERNPVSFKVRVVINYLIAVGLTALTLVVLLQFLGLI